MEGPFASVACWMTEVPALAHDPRGVPVAILSSTLSSCNAKVGLFRPKPRQQLRLFISLWRIRIHSPLTFYRRRNLMLQLLDLLL